MSITYSTQTEAAANFIDNGVDFANWTVDAYGSSISAAGIVLRENSFPSEFAELDCSGFGLTAGKQYLLRVGIDAVSGGAINGLRLIDDATFGRFSIDGGNHDFPDGTGVHWVVVTYVVSGNPYKGLYFVYRAGNVGDWARINECTLYELPASTVSLAVIGDATGGYVAADRTKVDNIVQSDAFQSVTDVIAVGDLSADGAGNDLASINASLRAALSGDIWSSPGNHDYDADRLPITGSGNWLDYFSSIPPLSPGSGEYDTYFRKKFGNVEIFFIDTNTENADGDPTSVETFKASPQGKWLIHALSSSTAQWKIVNVHIPAYASYNFPVAAAAAVQWTDWADHGVSFLLTGHYHLAEVLSVDGVYHVNAGTAGSGAVGPGIIHSGSVWVNSGVINPLAIKLYDGDSTDKSLVMDIFDASADPTYSLILRVKATFTAENDTPILTPTAVSLNSRMQPTKSITDNG